MAYTGTVFTLDPSVVTLATGGITDLVNQLGKQCGLLFDPIMSPCPNCSLDPQSAAGNKPTTRWESGGAVAPRAAGLCHNCGGTNQIATEVPLEVITMLVAVTPHTFFKKFPANIQVPDGTIQTKGFQTDLPKVLRSRAMVLSPDTQGVVRWRYELDGEPVDVSNITPGVFFVATWKRVG